jgi:hypothetical protein
MMEYISVLEVRNNYTNADFYVHTACDIAMFISLLFAERFPKLWDGVGFWWFLMYCTYHIATTYYEKYNFQDIRLLTADLQGYYLMLSIVLNSNYWLYELVTSSILYGITCWCMAHLAGDSAIEICLSLGIESANTYYEKCIKEFTTSNTGLFAFKAYLMVAFLSYVGRYSFESKERRLFLKGSYILQ